MIVLILLMQLYKTQESKMNSYKQIRHRVTTQKTLVSAFITQRPKFSVLKLEIVGGFFPLLQRVVDVFLLFFC